MGRAIVREPQAFLMDEPLSNLDAKLRVQMRTEIARIQDELNTTTIYVTHDQTEAMTLGDRITVMRAGELQQVGSPAELYEHPVNLFVAGFIGSPSMNFLPAEIDGDTVKLPIGAVKIPDELRRRLESGAARARGRVFAGLRPEHFQDAALVSELSHGTSFKTKIRVLESMGSEYYAYFDVAAERVSSSELEELAKDTGASDIGQSREGTQMVARLDAASKVRQGEEAVLWFDARKLQLFDEESGRSLLADGAGSSVQPAAPSA
jgi:multiple sugar transport system ATP-binding protein